MYLPKRERPPGSPPPGSFLIRVALVMTRAVSPRVRRGRPPSLIKRRSINSRRGKTTGTAWRAAKTTGRIAILRLDPAQLFEPVERNLNHIVWSIIAGQSKYGVNDSISRVCNEPPDNVDIDSCLRTQRR